MNGNDEVFYFYESYRLFNAFSYGATNIMNDKVTLRNFFQLTWHV